MRQQQNPGQPGAEQRQVSALHRAAIEQHLRFFLGQAQEHFVGVVLDIVLDQRQMCGDDEGVLLTLVDLVLQHALGQRFAGQQVTFQVFFVLRADIQIAAQRLKLADGHGAFDRYDIEQTALIGLADVVRAMADRFTVGEIVQGGIQQRDGAGHDACGKVDGVPRFVLGQVKAQKGAFDVRLDAVPLLDFCLEQRLGEGMEIDFRQEMINLVLRSPGLEVGRSEFVQRRGRCFGVPGFILQWRSCQGEAPADGGTFEIVVDGGLDEFVVPSFVRVFRRQGRERHGQSSLIVEE
ncbi:hypothetical protein D3C78_1096220 [compost metagenome]